MSSMKSWLYVGLCAWGGLTGCAGKQAGRESSEAQGSATGGDPRRGKHPGEKVRELDLNRDGKTDVWIYVVSGKGADGQERERMVRKEIDVNADGRVDITQSFNEAEEKVREEMDQDFDGQIDSTLLFEKGVNTLTQRDVDGNGKVDVWVYYENGKLVRKERDTNGDGKVDNWEYWQGDQVDRIGDDLDGDGKADRWTKNPNAPP
ncbi:hypothetical protein [Stigmatella aurantiaca]|uniref:Lipoprotein n=2 Tax=Stigmatella aurantiaca (strain DW4/3-1) TaxID=378806 RepID=Q08N34_STIAD|nr:hypothetical protein [Stigmatella aurantiaca]EAU61891.1 conserved hypothetical protein [Stigmatella aurantiaca DW4/3-1]